MGTPAKTVLQIGPFSLNSEERVLFRSGEQVALTPKALQLLLYLVENQGRLITKEELLESVWPGTFVEEAVLAVNIHTLRKVLGDDRNGHKYIETVPRRGYRFVGLVTQRICAGAAGSPAEVGVAGSRDLSGRPGVHAGRRAMYASLALAVLALAAVAWRSLLQPVSRPEEISYQQITASPANDPVSRAAISPDGTMVAYADLSGVHIRMIKTGATQLIPPPPNFCFR